MSSQSKRSVNRTRRNFILTVVLLVILFGANVDRAAAQSRRLKVSDQMLPFAGVDVAGQEYSSVRSSGKVVIVAFLSAQQKQSERIVGDLEKVLGELPTEPNELDFVAVIDKPEAKDYFDIKGQKRGPVLNILVDSDRKIWGKFGIIATPTVIITDRQNKVAWVKAGYSYDFASALRSNLNRALGIADQVRPEDIGKVKTVANTGVSAQISRHLQMAKLLEGKGRFNSAIKELNKSLILDPNSVPTRLELGRLYCRAGSGQSALDLIGPMKGKTKAKADSAKIRLILGWANRQSGQLDKAEQYLLEASKMDPRSSRIFFELGRVYEAKADVQKAMEAYSRSLKLIFKDK